MSTPVTPDLMSGSLMSVHSRRVISLTKNGRAESQSGSPDSDVGPHLVGALTLTSART
jgi:hypothetical protein